MSTDVIHGTGNVFEDLGYPDATERQTKVRLAMRVNQILKSRKLRQVDMARELNVPQPEVSALVKYQLDVFSAERLIQILKILRANWKI